MFNREIRRVAVVEYLHKAHGVSESEPQCCAFACRPLAHKQVGGVACLLGRLVGIQCGEVIYVFGYYVVYISVVVVVFAIVWRVGKVFVVLVVLLIGGYYVSRVIDPIGISRLLHDKSVVVHYHFTVLVNDN